MVDIEAAYGHCARLARAHYENFPVASRLMPRHARHHVAAAYAFARGADDLADEGTRSPEERLAALAKWGDWLHEAADGRPMAAAGPDAAVFVAVAATARACRLPLSLFDDLLSAFAQDVTVHRYATWAQVLDYCRRSANPIGRLVLRIAGYDEPELDRLSDNVCTALQLTNFWQDLAGDWARGRLYVPEEVYGRAGARLEDFDPAALSSEWRTSLTNAAARTHERFDAGRRICDEVSGRLRLELRLTWLGGKRILERLEAVSFDTVHHRPTLGLGDAGPLLRELVTWRRAEPSRP